MRRIQSSSFLPLLFGLILVNAVGIQSAAAQEHYAARNQYIVEFAPSVSTNTPMLNAYGIATQAASTMASFSPSSLIEVTNNGSIVLPSSNPEVVRVASESAVCHYLQSTGLVTSCSPNFQVQSFVLPNDPNIATQYWHDAIDSDRAWNVSAGGTNVIVAVLDTGVDFNHPDLADNMWRNNAEIPNNGIDDDANGVIDDVFGFNGINNSGNPFDDQYHGTHVAGIIGAKGNNGVGVAGVNWNTKIMALKFLSAGGSGFTSDAIKAMDYMIDMKSQGHNIRVINNSWGGGGFSKPLEDAIKRVRDAGIIFTAAAGNSATDNDALPQYPASYQVSNIVSVASSDYTNQFSGFSCTGANTVHIAAPGSGILSTYPGNRYESLSGTSMATPFVSGALGLLLADQPGLTMSQAITRLFSTAEPLPQFEGMMIHGRLLNVGNLLQNIVRTDPTVGEVCPYAASEIAYNPPIAVQSAAISMPTVGSNYLENFTLHLPFAFPYYSTVINNLTVNPNGVVFTADPQQAWAFRDAPFAPLNSIAPLYTPLYDYNIERDPKGIRVVSTAQRVDIQWLFSHPYNPSVGDLRIILSIFPDGNIESYISVPDDRLARSLQYGSLIGIRGGSLANSSTVTHNNFPVVVRGQIAYRFERAGNCITTSFQPTIAPTATPIPNPTQYYPPTYTTPNPTITTTPVPTASPRPRVLSVSLIGAKNKTGIIKTRATYNLKINASEGGRLTVRASLNGLLCSETFSREILDGVSFYKVTMPAVGTKYKNLSISVGGVSGNASITGPKLAGASKAKLQTACKAVSKSLVKAFQ